MNKISTLTQELVNSFPDWTTLRSERQSMGFQLINTLAIPMEDISFNLNKIKHNTFLPTVNLGEPDLIYKVDAKAYTFQENTQNGAFLGYVPPLVEGLLNEAGTSKVTLTNIEDGSLKSFWQDSDPDRITGFLLDENTPVSILNTPVDNYITGGVSFPIVHHLNEGGKFYFDLVMPSPYLGIENNEVKRARVRIEGKLYNGTNSSETIIFPWKGTIETRKKWKSLTNIECYDTNATAELSVLSELVNHSEYLSLSNLRSSDRRNKIDEFWGILNQSSPDAAYFERVEYISDEVSKLITHSADKMTKDRWALKELDGTPINEAKDMTLIPFKDKLWILGETTDIVDGTPVVNNKLYLFSLTVENFENLDKLLERDKNCEVTVKFVTEDIVTDEQLSFTVWHEREISKITGLQVYYEKPNGLKTYLTNEGGPGFEEYSGTRRILFQDKISVALEGEYIVYALIQTAEGTQTTCKIYRNNIKLPLREFDLSGIVPAGHSVEGIYYDAGQRLLLKTTFNSNSFYYQINEHKDIMLIDYNRKIIYVHEKYKGLDVT